MKTENNSGGIGFCGLLTIVFITLKLTGHISWSWFWVFFPIWMPLVAFLALVCFIVWAERK